MKSSLSKTFAGRSLYALLISALVTITAFGQHLVITGAPTLNGTGTYNIRGNITNTVPTTFTGTVTVTMNGAAAQSIGTTSNGAINFQTLNIAPTVVATTTLNVASTVSTAVNIGTAPTAATLAVGANNLTIGGTSALVNASSALTTAAGSTVTFNSAAAGQVVLGGFTYNGNLTLSGGTKTLNAATLTSVGVAFDASAAGLLSVSNGGLTLGTTGSFAAASISSGTITGGSGLATFNGLLTKTGTGNLTSGSGNLSLLAGLTNTAGNITLAAGQSMSISGGQFAYTAGTLTFPATSTVIYGAGATAIVDAPYGNLTLNGDAKTWALTATRTVSNTLTLGAGAATGVTGAFDLNVGGNVSLAANLTKTGNAVVFSLASSAVTGTTNEIVGMVTRTHAFVATTPYTFNSVATVVTPTAFTTLTSFSITSQLAPPDPTGYLADNSVDRKFQSNFTGTGLTADVQLGYLASEYTGSLPGKLKFFQGGIAKANKLGGVYSNGNSGSFNYVKLAALASLTSGSELGIDDRFNVFNSIANTAWNVPTTWDANAIPSATDDIAIIGTHSVTIPDGLTANALSVTIDGTTANALTVGAGAATTLNVGVGGLTNNATLGVLTVSTNAIVNITGGNLTTGGNITNNGTVTVQ